MVTHLLLIEIAQIETLHPVFVDCKCLAHECVPPSQWLHTHAAHLRLELIGQRVTSRNLHCQRVESLHAVSIRCLVSGVGVAMTRDIFLHDEVHDAFVVRGVHSIYY